MAVLLRLSRNDAIQIDIQEYSLHGSRMKTTLNIDETVMRRLREEATQRGTTMSALVEAGLRRILSARTPADDQPDNFPPLPSWRSGGFRIDISNRKELYRIMDGD